MTDPALCTLKPAETLESLKDDYFFPPYITLAHIFNAPTGWQVKPRTLSQYQFQYVVEGVAEYVIEGRSYLTKRGDLIFHGPNELHSVRTIAGEPYVCISVVFHFGDDSYPIQSIIGPGHYLGNFADFPAENRLTQLIARYHQPGRANHSICQGHLMQFIGEIADWRRDLAPQTKLQEKTKAKLVLVRNYIAKHYANDIRHQELESISGLSRNYIIVRFKKTFGMTPFEYLTSLRIERAKELVVQTNLSIGEIAQLVGYADVHTFGRMFKTKTGMTLSQFSSSVVAR